MKNLIKYFLNKLGYKIVRINPGKKVKIHTLTYQDPLFIEFVGVSGAGKTTLYKAMLKLRIAGDNWMGVKEYINYINGNLWPLAKDIHPVYKKILNKKYEQVTRKYNTKDTIGFMTFYLKNIKEEIIARHSNQKYTLIMEDGLFHNFGSAIIELHQKNEIDLISLIKNRALVFCYANPEIISKRIIERHQTIKHMRPQHKNKTLNELVESQTTSLNNKKMFVDLLRGKGLPVLDIDTSDNLESNAMKVKEFVKNLQEDVKSTEKE